MAHYFIFPEQDSTIYEDSVHQNAGIDQILDIEKQLIHAIGDVPFNSRVLIKFDLDSFSASLSSGELSGSNMRYYLNLYTDEAVEIPLSYTMYVYPVGLAPTTASLNSTFYNTTASLSTEIVTASLGDVFSITGSDNTIYIYSASLDVTASLDYTITTASIGDKFYISSSAGIVYTYSASGGPVPADDNPIFYFATGSDNDGSVANLKDEINISYMSGSISASVDASVLILRAKNTGSAGNLITFQSGSTEEFLTGGISKPVDSGSIWYFDIGQGISNLNNIITNLKNEINNSTVNTFLTASVDLNTLNLFTKYPSTSAVINFQQATSSEFLYSTNVDSGSQFVLVTDATRTYIASNPLLADTGLIYYFLTGSDVSESIGSFVSKINNSGASGSVSASMSTFTTSSATLRMEVLDAGLGANSYNFATGSGLTVKNFTGGETNIGSWEMGTGKRGDSPISKTGVSWNLRDGITVAGTTGSSWTASGSDFISGSGYEASQSFVFQTTDLHVDVTTMVQAWLDGTLDNHGFLIKRSTTDERSVLNQGIIQFFSNETHTIFRPRLEVIWKDYSHSPYTLTTTSQSVSSSADVDTRTTLNPTASYIIETSYTASGISYDCGYFTQSGDSNTWYSESYSWATESIYSYTSSIGLYHSSSVVYTYTTASADTYISESNTWISNSFDMTAIVTNVYTASLGEYYSTGSFNGNAVYYTTGSVTSSDATWMYNTVAGYYYSQSFVSTTQTFTWTSSSLSESIFETSSTTQVMFAITSEDFVAYIPNLYDEYRQNSKVRFRLKGRERYPRKAYVTESWSYTRDEYFLPTASYYSIRDGWAEVEWIPFSSYAQLSVDTSGSYFDLYLNGFEPERLYRIMFKTIQGGIERIIDNNYMFRIIR